MLRESLAIEGSPAASPGAVRLELEKLPVEESGRLRLRMLHDPQAANFARVFRGRIAVDEGASQPAAIKLQRDTALTREESRSVAAKFLKEREINRKLAEGFSSGAGERYPFARTLELLGQSAGVEGILPPCVVCENARHALAPRCPEDGEILEPDDLASKDADRRLFCPRCQARYAPGPSVRQTILEASIQRGAACEGCEFLANSSPGECLRRAEFLNFFPSHILLFEPLDLDLRDYLAWDRRDLEAGPPEGRGDAWTRFQRHQAALAESEAEASPSARGAMELARLAEIFSQIVEGVEALHARGIPHLDLKPANICLRLRGPDVEAKIVDLGLASDPALLPRLRQADETLPLRTTFAAPEMENPRREIADAKIWIDAAGEVCRVAFPSSSSAALEQPDPLAGPGDEFVADLPEARDWRFRVAAADLSGGEIALLGYRSDLTSLPANFGREEILFEGEAPKRGSVTLDKRLGPPADLFSLGMILAALLTGDPEPEPLRDALASLRVALKPLAPKLSGASGRGIIQALTALGDPHLVAFEKDFAAKMEAFGSARPLAEELLGLALRFLLRGDARFFGVEHRGESGGRGLRRLRSDLDRVRGALAATLADEEADGLRRRRLEASRRMRAWLAGDSARSLAASKNGAESSVDRRSVLRALDLGLAAREAALRSDISKASAWEETEFARLLAESGGDIHATARQVAFLEKELQGERESDFGPEGAAIDFLKYCDDIDRGEAALGEFVHEWRRVEQRARAGESAASMSPREERRLERWLRDREPLHRRLVDFRKALVCLDDFCQALQERALDKLDREFSRKRLFFRSRARVELTVDDRCAIDDRDAEAALTRLDEFLRETDDAAIRLREGFEQALRAWRMVCDGKPAALLDLADRAETEWERLRERHADWRVQAPERLEKVREHLATARRLLLRLWDESLANKKRLDESGVVALALSRKERDLLERSDPAVALDWLAHEGIGAISRAEASLALRERRDIALERGE